MDRTIEARLKELILDQYGTMAQFARIIHVPNATLASIMTRGIHNSNVLNVIKICNALGISTDELVSDKIVPKHHGEINQFCEDELNVFLKYVKRKYEDYYMLTLDGIHITKEESTILIETMECGLKAIRKIRKDMQDEKDENAETFFEG